MVTQIIGTWTPEAQPFSRGRTVAARLGPEDRRNVSLELLARTQPVSHLADSLGVSRKFLYQQAAKASEKG